MKINFIVEWKYVLIYLAVGIVFGTLKYSLSKEKEGFFKSLDCFDDGLFWLPYVISTIIFVVIYYLVKGWKIIIALISRTRKPRY